MMIVYDSSTTTTTKKEACLNSFMYYLSICNISNAI